MNDCNSIAGLEPGWSFRMDGLVALAKGFAGQSWSHVMVGHPRYFRPRLIMVRLKCYPYDAPM